MSSKFHIVDHNGRLLETKDTWLDARARIEVLVDAATTLNVPLTCDIKEVPENSSVPFYVVRKRVSDLLSEPICYVYEKEYADLIADLLDNNDGCNNRFKVTVS